MLERLVPASALAVRDVDERRFLMSAPRSEWYREQAFSPNDLVSWSPIVDVRFLVPFEAFNRV
ncbi:MAG: hypothetical protein QF921_10345 [Pseudomonadales bacterium]|nr:hypothetical protein [Pseudomonadales bacterium]MDP6469733.1 hypothetical protein [Pseudomonadales bacterium]MDP6827666.1 hypothetical protein [Pseudomonadales bacterium]MDP6971894.1 hypothetical protein [Pseudomonadales bacterium]